MSNTSMVMTLAAAACLSAATPAWAADEEGRDPALNHPAALYSAKAEEPQPTPDAKKTAPPGTALGSTAAVAPRAEASAVPPADGPRGDRERAPNSIYLEGLGAGLAYSLNYERLVIEDLGVRIGFSYLSLSASASAGGSTASSSASWMSFPITASYLGLRGRKSALELGGGVTLTYVSGAAEGLGASASGSGIIPTANALIGYRLHPVGPGAGFQFRVGLMAIAGKGLGLDNPDPTKIGFLPWGYISMGASF